MNLKILLPHKVFAEVKNVSRIVAETTEGFYGILPQRLDYVAALVPGIFTYETETTGITYVAVDSGIMVKAGLQVLVSVRNAIGNTPLGELRTMIEQEIKRLDENEIKARSVIAKLESSFMRSFEKFRRG